MHLRFKWKSHSNGFVLQCIVVSTMATSSSQSVPFFWITYKHTHTIQDWITLILCRIHKMSLILLAGCYFCKVIFQHQSCTLVALFTLWIVSYFHVRVHIFFFFLLVSSSLVWCVLEHFNWHTFQNIVCTHIDIDDKMLN